jgi:hypothetical protein
MNTPLDTSPAWWRDPRARQLVLVGIALIASGLAHAVVWAILGGPWEGPVTWRKPILFGISGGLTSLSAAWVWAKLPPRRGDVWLAAATAWALFVEVLLIDLQRWRGVASHFNRDTPLDAFLYDAMGVLILFVSAVLVDLTIRLFRSPAAMTPDMLLAARAAGGVADFAGLLFGQGDQLFDIVGRKARVGQHHKRASGHVGNRAQYKCAGFRSETQRAIRTDVHAMFIAMIRVVAP